jgi:hypothetical protein
MANKDQKIWLFRVGVAYMPKQAGEHYRVKKTQNMIRYAPGDTISRNEVREMVNDSITCVIIVGE